MAATAAVNRPPPVHPGPNAGNLHYGPNSSAPVPNSALPNPGLHGTSQDPGPSVYPQHHISARPVFYVPAPPPAPFLQYQWPMPFSFNPFAGFPGMGYGMVIPPFPPSPYVEAPTYILPHPHIQPVDYRRLTLHAPSAPHQNPNHTRRTYQPHTVTVRDTVNTAVQTEPTQRGVGGYGDPNPPVSSDSGHGSTSNSPSSSSSSSQKQGFTEGESYTLPSSNAKDLQVNRTCTNTTVRHGFNILHSTGTKTVQSCARATAETQKCCKDSFGQENVSPYRNGHCSMWSVNSPDSMVPSSSLQEDEVVKEGHVSVPDILSWGGGTPKATLLKMADKVLPQNNHQFHENDVEHEKSIYQSPTETTDSPVVAGSADANVYAENILSSRDGETLFKILKLPFALHELLSGSRGDDEPGRLVGSGSIRHCLPHVDELLHPLNKSHKLSNDGQENVNESNPQEDTTEIIPYQMHVNSCQMNRKMNESVWSVDSLAPFIPTNESLVQKGLFEPEIVDMTEEAENGRLSTLKDNLIVKSNRERRHSRLFSSHDSVPMSDSCLVFSTPAQKPSKKPEMESELDASEMRGPNKSHSMATSEKDPLVSPTHLPSKIILSTPTEEDVDENRSSEPEANQSPNQESFIVNEQQDKSPCSPEEEENCLNSAAVEKISSTGQLIIQNGVDMEVEDEASGNIEVSKLRNDQLCVTMANQRMAKVSPSKRHLVDCGVQCTALQELKCLCEESKSSMGPSRRHPFKNSDMKKTNGDRAEGFCMNGNMQKNQKRHGQWRNKGQEKQSIQQETYNGYCAKPGKSKGGNGRNPRY